jgi:hypothetical protein
MLGAAMLAGTSVASLEMRRAVRGRAAGARAEWEARRGVGAVVQGWSGALDSMPVGAMREQLLAPPADGPPTLITARVRRLSEERYSASVSVRVGAEGGAGSLAVRRVRLLLARASTPDSATPRDSARLVMPIGRWRVVESW